MSGFTPVYPRTFSGRKYRTPFMTGALEELGCEIDRLYESADLTRIERTTLIASHHHLRTVDGDLANARIVDLSGHYTSERPEVPVGLRLDGNHSSTVGYFLRVQSYADRLRGKYFGERPIRDI